MTYGQLIKKINTRISVLGLFLLSCYVNYCQSTMEHTQTGKNKNPNGRNDAWSIVGIGGGGAMFYPAVSPHDPNITFVGCDMTGSYVTYNGGLSWRMFNLRDRVRFFVFDPLDPNTVYANALGLFKSNDKGITWNILYPAPSEISGVISKGDHAEEILVTKDSTTRDVLALAVDPADSKKLYAAIEINKATALFISGDAGLHWKKEKELEDGAKKIFIDPFSAKEDRGIYIAGNNSITQRSNGAWKNYKGPKDVGRITEFSGGYDAQLKKIIIYAISGKSYFNPSGDKSGIYFTDNGGQTWENRQDGLLIFNIKNAGLPEWRTIATAELHPEVVYVSYKGLKVDKDTNSAGVAKSEDYGKTWKLVWKDMTVMGQNIPSANMKRDWLNERFSASWAEIPFSIGISPTDPGIVYGTDFGRTVKTNDGGKTWEQVNSKNENGTGWTSRGLDVTTGYCVVYDPADSKHVFFAKTDIGLLESKDGMVSWNSATKNNGVPPSWVNTTYWLTFDPEIKGRAWAVMSGTHDLPRPKMFRTNGTTKYKGGILVTENSGKTWKLISTAIGEAAMTYILIDPTSKKEARTLYACAFGKGVYKSTDGGNSWIQKNKGIEGTEPFAWQIVRRDKDDALFLIVSRRSEDGSIGNDKDGAIYKSLDGAENWTKISLPGGTNAPTGLVIDQDHPNKFILSAWGRKSGEQFTADTGGGIFLSEDEGKNWKPSLAKDQHISSITFDPRNKRYYACGFNGSAYFSEDGGNSWNRINGYNFKWGSRVGLDPQNAEKIFIITYGGGVWHGPAKGDEQAVEDIITLLK